MKPLRIAALLAAGIAAAGTFFSPLAAAQPTPPPQGFIDPGALEQEERRQQERAAQLRALEAAEPEIIIDNLRREDDYRLPDEGTSFVLQGVRFSDTEWLDEAALRNVAGRYIGLEIDFGDLNALADEINALYDERGIVTARALIPPQEIREGIVSILLVEGRLGELSIGDFAYTQRDFLSGRLELPEPGELLDVIRLQSSLARFNSLYELDLVAGLEPGEEFGHSNVTIVPREHPRLSVASFADNVGTETTGRERLGVTVTRRGLLGRDDRLFGYVAGARSSVSGLVSYNLPVNRRGGRFEASVSSNDIEVSRGPFRALDIEGRSYIARTSYRHPMMRRAGWQVDALAHASYTESRTDYLDGLSLSRHTLLKAGGGARAEHTGARHRLAMTQNVALVEADEHRTSLEDDYVLWDGTFTWVRYYGAPVYTVLAASWRLASDRELPSPDLYQAGGLYSVRGYEQNVISGARGYSASFELHWPASQKLAPYIFVDHGAVRAVSPRSEDITGVGAGLSWKIARRFDVEIDLARAATRIEPDQDRTQFHFRLNHVFDRL